MSRWLLILLLFGGLSVTSFLSMREADPNSSPAVHAMDDGGGMPTPRPR